MPIYDAPIKDFQFILNEVFQDLHPSKYDNFSEATDDIFDAILDEANKFAKNEMLPLNQTGDIEGCKFDKGAVTTPKGFKDLYNSYIQNGWSTISANQEYGGQGLPYTISAIIAEIFSSTNLSFGMYGGLTQGAINAIELFATKEIRDKYLPLMISGKATGTMNLTEPQAGTDLGLIKTKAVPVKDEDYYTITGSKIFISCGEHDLTDNIIHLVLARTPSAPQGVKGISLFLVPKLDIDTNKTNNVTCPSIEEKMGIHASSTCVINFDGSIGYLIGEENQGLKAMFTMMNEARLLVGCQGLGLSEISYQNAYDYAITRRQGRSLNGIKSPNESADLIIEHGDVRRMLLDCKSQIIAQRALMLYTALHIDKQNASQDEQEKQDCEDIISLYTPIIKAFFTDTAMNVTSNAIQVMGGYGYIKEYAVEQYLRDAKITQIYEGTNGIQALDLTGRKMMLEMGHCLRKFFHEAEQFIKDHSEDKNISNYIQAFNAAVLKLQTSSATIGQKALSNKEEIGVNCKDYLDLFSLCSLSYMWLLIMKRCYENIENEHGDTHYCEQLISYGNYYFYKILPQSSTLFKKIMSGANPVMSALL